MPSVDFTTVNGVQNNIPVATASGSNTLLSNNPTAPWTSSLSLGINETLYDNGVSWTKKKVAELNQVIAEVNVQKTRDQLVLNIVSQFYQYSLATRLVEVRRQQQAILEKQFRVMSSQYQQGFKTRSDFLRFKTQQHRAEIDSISAEAAQKNAAAQLVNLMGYVQDSASVDVSVGPQFLAIESDPHLKNAISFPTQAPNLAQFYDYKISALQDEVNAASVKLAERNYWPQLNVTSGLLYSNQNYINSGESFTAGNQLSWNGLLTLQYNIWDWGTLKRSVQVAELTREVQRNTLNQNLLDVKEKVSELMNGLVRIKDSFKLSQELLEMEEESNQNLEVQYREGKVTYLDLMTSLSDLLGAKVSFHTSYFDALTSLAQYHYYEGTLYEKME